MVRVARSKRRHLLQTKATELRLRTSETEAIMLERMGSGRRSLMVGVAMLNFGKKMRILVD